MCQAASEGDVVMPWGIGSKEGACCLASRADAEKLLTLLAFRLGVVRMRRVGLRRLSVDRHHCR